MQFFLRLRLFFLALIVAGTALFLALPQAQPASAATITVNSTIDNPGDGACSFKEAEESARQNRDIGGCAHMGNFDEGGEDVILIEVASSCVSPVASLCPANPVIAPAAAVQVQAVPMASLTAPGTFVVPLVAAGAAAPVSGQTGATEAGSTGTVVVSTGVGSVALLNAAFMADTLLADLTQFALEVTDAQTPAGGVSEEPSPTQPDEPS